MTKIYCAGPLFNEAEREDMTAVAHALEAGGFDTFLPHRDGIEMRLCKERLTENGMKPEEASKLLSLLIFCMDVYQVLEGCDALVMNLNGRVPDEGAVSESAIAWTNGKPVVAYKADPRSLMYGCDNPLVAGLFGFDYCHSLEELPNRVRVALDKSRKQQPSDDNHVAFGREAWKKLNSSPDISTFAAQMAELARKHFGQDYE